MDETNKTSDDYLELQSVAAAAAAEEEAAGRDFRTSLQFSIIQICAQQDRMNQTRTSSQAIKALTELTFQFATTSLSQDLDAFSSHANRKRITLDDVKLVLRKSSENLARLQDYCEQELLVGGPQQQQQQHAGVVEVNNGSYKDGRSSRVKDHNASTTTMTTSAISGIKRRTGSSAHVVSKRPPRQFDLTSPKVDDSSSSDDSVSLRRESVGITKISSGAMSKKIDTSIGDSDDDEIVQPRRTNFRDGKKAVGRGAQKKRILESSRSDDDDDDDDDDVHRGIRRQKSNLSPISQTRRHEQVEPGKLGYSSTQTMRIMAEMSPHSAASDDESNVDEDDDIDENKDINTRRSKNLGGTTLKEPPVESSSSTEEEETEFD
jgi:histone H3/H4